MQVFTSKSSGSVSLLSPLYIVIFYSITYSIFRNLNLSFELSDKNLESSKGSNCCSYLLLAGLLDHSSKIPESALKVMK